MLKIMSVIIGLLCAGTSISRAEIDWQTNLDFFGSGGYQRTVNSPINPQNRILEIKNNVFTFELRPEIQLQLNENTKMVLRARWLGEYSSVEYLNPQESNSSVQGRLDLSDGYLAWQLSESTLLNVGLQNYQWGPAELYSPTNPFFHFNSQQKSFFYKEKGHALIRFNCSLWDGINLAIIREPIANNEKYWTEDREFVGKSLLKLDVQFPNRANYLSVVTGTEELNHFFVGEYLNWSVAEGTSVYADARHTRGRANYVPELNALGTYNLLPADSGDLAWQTLAVAGVRFEYDSFDLRQEYLYNSAGYSEGEWNSALAATSFLNPNVSVNLRRFSRPGLEFHTKNYSYTSLRIPDLGRKKDASFYVRYLSSLTDRSGVLQLDFDKNWNDSVVLYFEGMLFHGSYATEFRLSDDYQIFAGFKKSL
jgi:hypothetical protein